jgi:FAD/FMN-containing dehydrogenase
MANLSGLSIHGRVATEDDSDWDQARQAWNLAADQHPAAIAFVQSAHDVSKVITFARENGLRVTAQGTGHGATALPGLEDTILIKTERMKGIDIDAENRTARVEAGVLAVELGSAAHKKGLCSLPGSSPDTGVVGYTLGGGLSWFGRRHGFACNRVIAIELVTADGKPRQVDAEATPDLFWALRGGGGGYAIVTALHLDLLDISEVYAGGLIFPAEVGADGLRAARDWAAAVSEDVTSNIRFLTPPPLPDVPEPIRGKPLFAVSAACIGSEADGQKAIAPLREIGDPIMDTFAQIPTSELSTVDMDPDQPVPGLVHSAVLGELPDEAIDAFVAAAGPDSGSPLLGASLRHTGGALARPAENAGALEQLDGEFVVAGIGVLMDPGLRDTIDAALDRLIQAMEPWLVDGAFFNFTERPCDVDAILPEETCRRLAHVKRSWDPDDLILANHSVALATA